MVTVADLATLLGVDASGEATRLQAAIDATPVVDSAGRPPTDPDWVPTSDIWFAAAAYVDALAISRALDGTITSFTSEGSSFQLAAPDLAGFAAHLRRRSPLWPTSNISVVTIDNDGDWFPRSSFPRRTW